VHARRVSGRRDVAALASGDTSLRPPGTDRLNVESVTEARRSRRRGAEGPASLSAQKLDKAVHKPLSPKPEVVQARPLEQRGGGDHPSSGGEPPAPSSRVTVVPPPPIFTATHHNARYSADPQLMRAAARLNGRGATVL